MMRQLLVQFSRESFVYGLSVAAAKIAGLVLVPMYTNALAKAEFGALDLLTSGTSILSTLLILGMDGAIALRYYGTDDPTERQAIATTFLLFETGLVGLVCGV